MQNWNPSEMSGNEHSISLHLRLYYSKRYSRRSREETLWRTKNDGAYKDKAQRIHRHYIQDHGQGLKWKILQGLEMQVEMYSTREKKCQHPGTG